MATIEPGKYCPLIKKDCIGTKCAWYTQVRGINPNTGHHLDEWRCAVSWMPILSIEVAQKSNQTGAAIESFRNEVVKTSKENQKLFVESLNQGIIPSKIVTLDSSINILNSGED